MNRVRLLVFNAALGALDYRVPAGMAIEFGSVVVAPLGPRQIVGIAWEAERLPAQDVPESKLRPILEVLPTPPLPAPLRRLIEWTADYYCARMASGMRMRRLGSSRPAVLIGVATCGAPAETKAPGRLPVMRIARLS